MLYSIITKNISPFVSVEMQKIEIKTNAIRIQNHSVNKRTYTQTKLWSCYLMPPHLLHDPLAPPSWNQDLIIVFELLKYYWQPEESCEWVAEELGIYKWCFVNISIYRECSFSQPLLLFRWIPSMYSIHTHIENINNFRKYIYVECVDGRKWWWMLMACKIEAFHKLYSFKFENEWKIQYKYHFACFRKMENENFLKLIIIIVYLIL